MKIAMISSGKERCGIASYTWDLVSTLKKSAELEYIVYPNVNKSAEWRALADRLNKTADVIHIQYHPHYLGYWRTPGQIFQFYRFMKSLSKPVVVTIHDLLDSRPFRPQKSTWRSLFYSVLLDPFLKHTPMGCFLRGGFLKAADHLIVHWKSPRLQLLSLGFTEKNISILYPGIPDLSHLASDPEPEKQLKGKRAVGIFGFIRSHKGYEATIQAFTQLPEDIVLLIVGDIVKGDEIYLETLKESIRNLGLEKRVIFTGYLPDAKAAAWLKACRLILLPYVPAMETGSYSLSHAFAAGQPVLTSDASYFREIHEKYGVPAIFERNNVTQLAREIARLLTGDTELEKKVAAFRKEWSWDQVAAKTLNLYGDIQAKKNGVISVMHES